MRSQWPTLLMTEVTGAGRSQTKRQRAKFKDGDNLKQNLYDSFEGSDKAVCRALKGSRHDSLYINYQRCARMIPTAAFLAGNGDNHHIKLAIQVPLLAF